MRWMLDSEAAMYSRLVYENPERLKDYADGDVTHCEGPEHGADVYIFEGERYTWAVFRGVDLGTAEFLGDLKTALRAYRDRVSDKYRLHRGFFEAWREVSVDVHEEVYSRTAEQQWWLDQPKPVVYCGHSAGGALATIAAATHCPQSLITFGAPRVGNKNLAEPLSKIHRHHRWTNGADVVPSVPFGLGYRHHGHHVHIKLNGEIVENPTWFRRAWDIVRGVRELGDDHNMLTYKYGVMAQQYLEASDDLL